MPDPMLITSADYEAYAHEHLDHAIYDFVAGGADEELTLRENRAGFERLRLIPRVLRDVSNVSPATTAFGVTIAAPLFVSPIGMQRLVHEEAELGTARATRELRLGFMVATASTCSLEDLADNGGDSLWFQLYWRRDRAITRDLVERAHAAGYKAIVLTADTSVIGRRLRDVRNQFQRPATIQYANFARYEDPSIKDKAGAAPTYYVADQMDRTLTWADIEWLRDVSKLPVVIKGILSGDDARLAIDAGAQGVMVSNHGGRQLDHVPGTIDALEEIVDAVAGEGLVILDGGVRYATDILLALSVGADLVAMGRPVLWALTHGGGASVQGFLASIVSDLTRVMTLAGVATPNDADRASVRRLARLERLSAGAPASA